MIGQWAPFAFQLIAASIPLRFATGLKALTELMAQAAPAWQRLVSDLGDPQLLRLDGHYCVWESVSSASKGRDAWRSADIGSTIFMRATDEEIERLRALSPPIEEAIRFAGTGQVTSLDAVRTSFGHALKSLGIRTLARKATLAIDDRGRARVPGTDADAVVVAAGIGSAELMRSAGHVVPLIAERGYHIRSHDFDWPEDLSPLVFEDRSLIATRFLNSVQLSSFVEFATADAPPDPRKWARLERHAAELQLRIRAPFEHWFGSRPTPPDYLPAIGRSSRAPNLYYAFGHQHLGLTLGPLTGELIAGLIAQEQPSVDLSRLRVERFD